MIEWPHKRSLSNRKRQSPFKRFFWRKWMTYGYEMESKCLNAFFIMLWGPSVLAGGGGDLSIQLLMLAKTCTELMEHGLSHFQMYLDIQTMFRTMVLELYQEKNSIEETLTRTAHYQGRWYRQILQLHDLILDFIDWRISTWQKLEGHCR